jgi:hypothetical protein
VSEREARRVPSLGESPAVDASPRHSHRCADNASTQASAEVRSESRSRRDCRLRVAAAAVVLACAGAVIAAGGARDTGSVQASARTPDGSEIRVLYTVEDAGLRLEFHAVMGTEVLSRTDDPRRTNLLAENPEIAARLRDLLLRREGAPSLEALRAPHRELVAQLEQLGYL